MLKNSGKNSDAHRTSYCFACVTPLRKKWKREMVWKVMTTNTTAKLNTIIF